MQELGYNMSSLENAMLETNMPLFPEKKGSDGYLGDTALLGIPASINRYQPRNLSNVLEWELISKTLYSHRDLNPRKRIGSSLKEGLGDVTREVILQTYRKNVYVIFIAFYMLSLLHALHDPNIIITATHV